MEPLSSIPSPSTTSSSSKKTSQAPIPQKTMAKPLTPPTPSASISISQSGKEIQPYTEAIADLPDVRQDRITKIQAALENQTYTVSPQDLADKMIQDIANPRPSASS